VSRLTGPKVLLVWMAWALVFGALSRLTDNVGIALPISTSAAIVLSKVLAPILLLVLFAPPLLLTVVWWRRRRRSGAAPG
jgi:hypothetical protein